MDNFPSLEALGLVLADVAPDGNCLFRALADQEYGDDARHAEVRDAVVRHLAAHEDHYRPFVGEGREWQQHLVRMAQDGTYGDNLEIVAFASAFGVRVRVYQPDLAYDIGPATAAAPAARTVHIAYHSWEHYSSVRRRGGPRRGPPDIPEVLVAQPVPARTYSYVQPWMVDSLLTLARDSIDGCADLDDAELLPRVKDALEAAKGNLDTAYESLSEAAAAADGAAGGGDDPVGSGPPADAAKATKEVPTAGAGRAGEIVRPSSREPGRAGTAPASPPGGARSTDSAPAGLDKGSGSATAAAAGASKTRSKKLTARERKEKQKREARERKRQPATGATSTPGDGAGAGGDTSDVRVLSL
ncbi:uncharacterized protein V1510DRAFT_180318 [Dipodascopsis tothii]|uniref:uncharacterized protein n=1 Tax=Dipodascopsis tothii TaxID=44089 RepID=UPI0034CD165A